MIDTIVALMPVTVAIITFVISFLWGVITYRNQMNSRLFLQFTKRYDEIMGSFPPYAKSARLHLKGAPPRESDELTLVVLRYLNLCGEEYYLHKEGLLDKRVWGIWERELINTLKSPLLRRGWNKVKEEFKSYDAFTDYVNAQQGDMLTFMDASLRAGL